MSKKSCLFFCSYSQMDKTFWTHRVSYFPSIASTILRFSSWSQFHAAEHLCKHSPFALINSQHTHTVAEHRVMPPRNIIAKKQCCRSGCSRIRIVLVLGSGIFVPRKKMQCQIWIRIVKMPKHNINKMKLCLPKFVL